PAARGGAAAGAHPGPAGAQHGDAHRDRGAQPSPPPPRPAQRARVHAADRSRRGGRPPAVVSGRLRVVVVTGLSGSGKSTAIRGLEDLGFYCIDNLPVALIPRFVELWERSGEDVTRAALRELIERAGPGTMTVSLVSFGYKYGLPSDADLAIDCRFLPNPFFVEELRHRTGTDPAVAEYVLARDETEEFLQRLTDFLDFALPRYLREGKSYLTIALGCTGGRHRSVVLVEELRRRLAAHGHAVLLRHRDAER